MAELDANAKKLYDLDLDTLVGATKSVKLNGKEFTLSQPDLGELLKLTKLGAKLQEATTSGGEEGNEAVEVMGELRDMIAKLAPPLAAEPINVMQMIALLNLLVDMAMPSSVEEFEKRGITLTNDQKKILSGYLKQ